MKNSINNLNMHRIKKNTINHIYTFILVSSPLLFLYGIGVSNITLVDFFLLALNMIFMIRIFIDGKIMVFTNLMPFLFYIVVLSLVTTIDMDSTMRTLRYVFYLVNIVFFTKKYFDYRVGVKIYRYISLVSTVFLFIQIITYKLVGIYLPGVVLSANLVASDLYNYDLVLQNAYYKRFMSFFAEPSHFAIYVLGYITILLFSEIGFSGFRKKDMIEFAFLSLGVVLSTSILGVMVLGAMSLIWLMVFVFNRKKNYKNIFGLTLFFLVVISFMFFLQNTTAFEYFSNSSVLNRQAEGRFGGYSIFGYQEASTLEIIFGRGMVGMPIISNSGFLPSFPLLYYYFGFIGLILFFITFIPYFLNLKVNVSKALIICLFGIALGSELLLGIFILVFIPLIINGNIKNPKLKELS